MNETSGTEVASSDNLIAIVGISGRFPGAGTVEQFWRNLMAGTESITRFTEAELEDSFPDEVRRAPNFVKARPLLADVDQFDAEFFGMYAREAALTDPQHRIFLECCWEALEDAGCDPAGYRGPIGVFAGCSIGTYFLQHVCGDRRTTEEFTSSYQVGCYPMLLGSGMDFLSTRVSYKLDLKGPSLTLQTACSTSLLAVAQACQSLLLYQSDMALAGGVSITFPQKRGYLHQEGGMVSADGSCRPFDADASGTIFGSGAGVVALKRLEDAIADRDYIYAVIRGSGITNDGSGKVGFTAPSVEGQAAAIEMAHANAGIEARSISYVECHGTATPLGDPIEVAALTRAFAASTQDLQFCALGSVKSNIGHLDAAAGVVGLIKTALALKHEVLPASLHYQRPNPQIDFPATPFFVNSQRTAWPRSAMPRRAGVSAFGVGGTNVHVVLEEPPLPAVSDSKAQTPQLLVLSARTPAALLAARNRLAAHLDSHPGLTLADVAYSLQHGRRAFEHRTFVVARDAAQARELLAQSAAAPSRAAQSAAPVAFMFPGQGAQYPGMARDLLEHEPEFRRHFEQCLQILQPLLGDRLQQLLYPAAGAADTAQELMATCYAQPAIFAIEYSLAKLWMSWGIKPQSMIGHSIGEFVAAVLAGVMKLDDALLLVALRGQLMQQMPGGSMLAVRLPEQELQPLLPPGLDIAAVNGPALSVASGPHPAIEALEQVLKARGAIGRRLHTSHAFHSAMMDPIVAPLRERLAQIRLSPPTLPYVSCVSGTWITDAEATSPEYWAQHTRATVRFAAGVATLAAREPAAILLEVGPGNVLSTLALQTLKGTQRAVVTSLQDAARERSDQDCLLEAAGRLWCHGAQPDWAALGAGAGHRVPLPTYPFERKRFWIDAPATTRTSAVVAPDAADPQTPVTPITPSTTAEPVQDDHAMSSDTPARTQELSTMIAAVLEELSGNAPASVTEPITFLEMGYDSLFLTQVAQKIQSQTKVKITFRQLLGDYSSIPALAAHLAEKMPAAPAVRTAAVAAAPAARAASAAVAPAASLSQVLPQSATPGLEGLFREQLQAMSELINRQFAMLQGGTPAAAVALAPPPTAMAAVAQAKPAAPAEAAAATPSRFQVFNPKQAGANGAIAPEHQRHIDELATRYSRRQARSKELTQQYRKVLADPRAASGFRVEWKELVFPVVVERAAGSRLWDVDGNEYVDLVNGFGQTAFGHSPDFVVKALRDQLEHGFPIGPQADMAGKVAALFCEITGNERMTFCNTGSEAVMAAMRIARTVTGREKIVIFNGDYHGQFDEVLVKGVQRPGTAPRSMPVAPGIPASAVQNIVVLEYATPATLQWIRDNAEDLAAVIVEPVQSRHPSLQPYEFLREVRSITEQSGTAFVMDEVVTGFRTHPGGIQALAGVRADLATYGKVVGGGLPIGVLAGNSRFMDALDGGPWNFGDGSFPETGVTFFAGTFVRHPLALAAAWAVLNHIKEHGPQLQERLAGRTARLVADLNALFERYGLATRLETFASWFYFNIHNEHPLASLLFQHLRLRGVHIQDGFPCFLTTAHSDADLDLIRKAFSDSLAELNAVGILGKPQDTPATGPIAGLPLTESQTEIWLAAQMGDDASCAFNESVSLRMKGRLNETALRAAVSMLFARHDALRASFSPTGEEMHIGAAGDIELPVQDLSGPDAEARLNDLLTDNARTAFDLVNAPAARVQLVRLAADEHVLVFTAHHIVCDGWSINVFVNELAEIYPLLCRGETPQLAPALPFSRYAQSQAGRDPADLQQTEGFWLEQFREPVKPLDLPTDRPRPARKTYHGASRFRRIDAALYQAIKKSGAKAGNTLFVTLLGAFEALIGRLSGQSEVVVGVPTAGQSLLEDQILVGHCVNFLPLRASWNDDTTVTQHLRAVAKTVLDAYEHQDYTLGTLVRKLAPARDLNRVPLAEIQFNLERLADQIVLADLAIEVSPNSKTNVNFDLFLNVIESDQGLRLDCDYNTDLFDASTIDRWLDCYQALLEAFVADPAQTLERVPYLTATQRQQVLQGNNQSDVQWPESRCIHQLFETQAAATPRAIAVQFRDSALSYEALDRRAGQLARLLQQKVGSGSSQAQRLVGIAVERSVELLVALLAVQKAGYAYVPLDPGHPPARLRYILDDADVAALITDGSVEDGLLPAARPVIHLERDAAAIAAAVPPTRSNANPDSLAYVIYTSGSTGQPKGVEVSHAAVVNFLRSMSREPGLSAADVMLSVTTISFDIAALELYLPLCVGAKVVIAEREEIIDGFALNKRLESSRATVMQATPVTWRMLLDAGFAPGPGLKMLCGGEALPTELAHRLAINNGVLWNMYGPTETTIWSTCGRISPGQTPISVGKPIANTQIYVLDRHGQPVVEGVIGELYIAGQGVARGYHKRTQLTAERFSGNPFQAGRMYRTGDLARWLPNGQLQVLGRMDHQVKLRGFRLELGEIESVLGKTAGISAAAVTLVEDSPGDARLVAWYTSRPGSRPEEREIRSALAGQLPQYMIPSAFVELDSLPLTPNGKLDRAALPKSAVRAKPEAASTAPASALEAALIRIWSEVLRLDPVGIQDDLLDLGADSIQLFQITARANRMGIKLTTRQLLQHRTIAALASLAEHAGFDGTAAENRAEAPSLSKFKRNPRGGSVN